MLSKEEIEKSKDFMIFYKNYCLNKETANTEHYETANNEEFVYKNIETMLEYIDQLESREQKLIEKLEEINTRNVELYNSPKQKEVDFSEWNLAQELLEILKKE